MSDSPYALYRLERLDTADSLGPGRFVIRNERRHRPTTEIDLRESIPTSEIVTLLEVTSDPKMRAAASQPVVATLSPYTVVREDTDSLRDAEPVRAGDFLVVNDRDPEDGDLVVMISHQRDGDVVVARTYHEGDPPTVTIPNPHLSDLETPVDEYELCGVVVGFIRRH